MLKLDNLTLVIGKTTILNRISFGLQEGEILGVTGPSGCGKTTLLKALSGNIKIPDNTIELGGRDINEYRTKKLRKIIAFLPSAYEYNPESTIFQEVLKGRLHLKKMLNPYSDFDRESTFSILKEMGIPGEPGKRMKHSSDSLKRISLIGQTLNSEKDITFLDSPDRELDALQKIFVIRTIKKFVSNGGRSVIIASSDIDFLIKTCDRIIFLKNGAIAGCGSADLITEDFMHQVFGINTLISRNIVTGLPEIQVIDIN